MGSDQNLVTGRWWQKCGTGWLRESPSNLAALVEDSGRVGGVSGGLSEVFRQVPISFYSYSIFSVDVNRERSKHGCMPNLHKK